MPDRVQVRVQVQIVEVGGRNRHDRRGEEERERRNREERERIDREDREERERTLREEEERANRDREAEERERRREREERDRESRSRSRDRPPRGDPPGMDTAPGVDPIAPAPFNGKFTLDREMGRDLRSWMTAKLKPAEGKQLREKYVPSFRSDSSELLCPQLDSSMSRRLKDLKSMEAKKAESIEKSLLA